MTYQLQIKKKREHLGITQQEAADKLGIHLRSFRRYENLEVTVPYDMLVKIKKLLEKTK